MNVKFFFTRMNFHHVKTENKIHTYKSIKIYLYIFLWPKIALTRNRHKDGWNDVGQIWRRELWLLLTVNYEMLEDVASMVLDEKLTWETLRVIGF